jgi:adenosylmethionine-8-amino-7-oxononanoate aminotransferase
VNRVFHRDARQQPPVAVAGDGPYLVDREGRRYLDASGGAAVSCLGHGHRAVIDAIKAQADKLAYAHTAFFSSEPAEALADFLTAASGNAFEQYFLESGEPDRELFIGRRQSYHGNTLGALAVGGNAWRRKPFAPLLMSVEHVSPCYAYRDRKEGESEAEYGARLAAELEETLQRVGPQRVIAFIAEPVVGATLGAVPAVPGYFRRVREICDRYCILLILDEVMCGMGRTGTLFAYEQEGIVPDLCVIAKGLGGGYQPIGATLVSKKIFDAVQGGSGFFQHGHTYLGHPLACAAALAVQHTLVRERLLENVSTQGEVLRRLLNQRFSRHAHIGDVRGRGLFLGIELVADRTTKSPFDPALKLHQRVKREAFARGLICYPMGGTIDGLRGDHVLLAPPYIVDGTHCAEIADKLADAIDAALAGV